MAGKRHIVGGDWTKVRFVKGLPRAAQRLVQNVEHASRQLPGTHQVRKLMRFATHAGRIRRGVPIFVTFSPDEKHNLLMLRLPQPPLRRPPGAGIRRGLRGARGAAGGPAR